MNIHLNILIKLLINEYFKDSRCLIIFTNNFNGFDYHGDLPRVIVNVNNLDVMQHLIFEHYGCQGFVIIDKSPATILDKIEMAIKFTDNRFNFRRYMCVQMENEHDKAIMDIFESPAMKFISDFLIAIPSYSKNNVTILNEGDVTVDLYTHKYIGNNTNDIVLLDTWFSKNNSFSNCNNLYPEKLKNQFGRELKIAAFTYKPYSVADPVDGVEVLIALEYARRHNMTPRLIVDEQGQWGEVYDNWTGFGLIGNTAMDRSDIGLGALYTWEHEYHFLDLSKPTLRTGITCISPMPKLIGGWITPFIAFSMEMWIAVGFAFVCCFLSVLVVTSYEVHFRNFTTAKKNNELESNVAKSLMKTEAMFLLQSVPNPPLSQFSRIVFALNLILCLTLTSIYNTALASNMTVPRYHGTIRTAEDLAASDISWGATSTAWISSIMNESQPTYRKLLENFIYTSEANLIDFNNKRFSFSVERLQGGSFAIGSYITKEGANIRRLMNEDIYSEFCVIMGRKSSILMPSIDNMILRISQTGIINFWEYQVVARNLDSNIQEVVKHSTRQMGHGSEPISLKLSHVEGAFAIWIIGILASFLSFIFEIFSFKNIY